MDINFIKKLYKKGTRVKLIHMVDDTPIPDGTLGTVDQVDDVGTIFVDWDNGRYLGLVLDYDEIEIIDEE